VRLTNLPPGSYNIPVMTRAGLDGDFVTNTISFTVTNRTRLISKYTIMTLPGGTNTTAARINNKGQVIGVSGKRAFLYDGEMHFLGSLGGEYSEAISINNNGGVVGVSEDAGGIRRAFVWDAQNGMQALPVNGSPTDINDDGDIIGNGEQGAFLYRNGTIVSLPGTAVDINNRGVVVLGYDVQKTRDEPRWNEFLRFGRPLVYGEDPPGVRGTAINDANEVTGYENSSVGGGRFGAVCAFRFRAFNRFRITGRGAFTWPKSINLLGDIVGSSSAVTYGDRGTTVAESPSHAFLTSNSGFYILNNLVPDRGGLDVTNAISINDRREIVAVASKDGETFAVLMQPIPGFQTISFDPGARKVNASVEGLISTRVRIEKSGTLKDWELHSAQELTDAPVEIALPLEADNDSVFLRIVRD
jgi:probable HAF family extracellular repeat protein